MKRKSGSNEDDSAKPSSKSSKKAKVVKDEEEDASESGSEVAETPVRTVKKPTKYSKAKAENSEDSGETKVEVSADGEKFINLGKNKRATVRSFKGATLIDIREFYVDKASGETKPGKKGVSLSVEQWQELKQATKTLDELIAQVKK
ncbi:Activated RNA polymerase II transcriptional coactivator p15 [Mycena sanguinolenta]|uniref:Activated RNA polymerase II transcriptional coactivator p15 n=1 Tax=Mycena sanguinolenta TaxID=230812 RepID=A0A8H6ZFY0_9AGAR|nr:Activated RNA polymerase II transcriptional coactivator p15 [Mycena sanguinolenta]